MISCFNPRKTLQTSGALRLGVLVSCILWLPACQAEPQPKAAPAAKVAPRQVLATKPKTAAAAAPKATAPKPGARLAAQVPVPLAAQGEQLRFLVFGDWGSGSTLQKQVAEGMARYAEAGKAQKPLDFVIATGDNFYDNGVKSTTDPQWQDKFENVYDKVRLNVPFYVVLGNHDWRSDPMAQITYSATPGTRWKMDGFYFKKSFPPGAAEPLADILFIDANTWNEAYQVPGLGSRQLKWLEENLKTSKARWQFVVQHQPVYSDGAHGHEAETSRLRTLLTPLYQKYGVDAVFAGHDHDLQRIVIPDQKTMYLVSGAGGASLRARSFNDYGPFYAEKTGGFLAIDLTPTTLRGTFLDAETKVLHEWTQTPFDVTPEAQPQPQVQPQP